MERALLRFSVVVSEFVSLDGVIENPMWTFPYWNDEIANFKHAELFGSDTLLLGRVTYAGFAEAWPSRTDEQGYADRINGLPKAVITTTLDKLAWNNSTAIRGNITEEVNKLKQQSGQDVLRFGSGKLVQTLMDLDLVDQYNLLSYPVILGKGQRLFEEGREAKLKLVETKPYGSGVVGLIYQPDRKG
jgi:dihydrofolate reductase